MSEDFIELKRDMKAIMTEQLPEIYRQLSRMDATLCRHADDISALRKSVEAMDAPNMETTIKLLEIQNSLVTLRSELQHQVNEISGQLSSNRNSLSKWIDRILAVAQALLIALLVWLMERMISAGGL